MKIKYMGKLDPETNPLPTNKLKERAIRFNEPTDRKKQNIQTSIVTFIIICIMFVPEYLNVLFRDVDSMDLSNLFSYFILANILLVLSKLCQFYFYKEIYMFKIPRVGFAGVYTTEFTKKKYIAINLIPDILFGLVPYYISLTTCKFFFRNGRYVCCCKFSSRFHECISCICRNATGFKNILISVQ